MFCLQAPVAGALASDEAATFSPVPAERVETLTAYTRAETTMQIASEVPGRVLEVYADVGEQVPRDGVFARVDDTFVRLDLAEQRVQRRRLETRRDYYRKEALRYRDLVAGRHADQSTLDRFEQELAQAELQLEALDVTIERLTEQLQRHKVRAPAGFRVITRAVEPGEWVAAGQVLAELGDFRTLVAPFALDLAQFDWLQENAGELELDVHGADSALRVAARLHEVSPAFDPQTRKINVQLAYDAEQTQARGGLRVQLQVPLPDRSGAMLVPASAVSTRYEQHWLTRPDGSRLYVVLLGSEPDGRLRVQAPELTASQRFLLEPKTAPASPQEAGDETESANNKD